MNSPYQTYELRRIATYNTWLADTLTDTLAELRRQAANLVSEKVARDQQAVTLQQEVLNDYAGIIEMLTAEIRE